MEQLTNRARAAMNAIIIGAMILGWVAFQADAPVRSTVSEIFELADRSKQDARSSSLNFLLDEVRVNTERGMSLLDALDEVQIGILLSLTQESFTGLFGYPDETKTARVQSYKRISKESTVPPEEQTNLKRKEYEEALRYSHETMNLVVNDDGLRFRDLIQKLSQMQRKAGVHSNATVGELAISLQRQVKLPWIEQSMSTKKAIPILAVVLIGPYLYLISICSALRFAIHRMESATVSDWIFFHPGILGGCIGLAWLLFPSVAALIGWGFHGIRAFEYALAFCLLISISGLAMKITWTTRSFYLEKLGMRSCQQNAGEGPG